MTLECPVCHSSYLRKQLSAEAIRSEIALRDRFVSERMPAPATPAEAKDLTDFMHGFPAPLLRCRRCGTLLRAEQEMRQADSYEEDPNDPGLMAQVYPRYVEAFRNKSVFRSSLRPHAEVLEIGSHLGAFLQVAEEWNWNATGLDVGRDTSEFARRNGLRVIVGAIESDSVKPNAYEGVFVWNCFEQLPDPGPVLRAIRRALKPFGLLTIRVPNVSFYLAFRNRLSRGNRFALQALAYNNLLGFPYLHGYSFAALNALLRSHGFEYVQGYNSELVTMPFPDETALITREQNAISDRVAKWSVATTRNAGKLTGPWIEVLYRRMSDREMSKRTRVVKPTTPDLQFLPRAA